MDEKREGFREIDRKPPPPFYTCTAVQGHMLQAMKPVVEIVVIDPIVHCSKELELLYKTCIRAGRERGEERERGREKEREKERKRERKEERGREREREREKEKERECV